MFFDLLVVIPEPSTNNGAGNLSPVLAKKAADDKFAQYAMRMNVQRKRQFYSINLISSVNHNQPQLDPN